MFLVLGPSCWRRIPAACIAASNNSFRKGWAVHHPPPPFLSEIWIHDFEMMALNFKHFAPKFKGQPLHPWDAHNQVSINSTLKMRGNKIQIFDTEAEFKIQIFDAETKFNVEKTNQFVGKMASFNFRKNKSMTQARTRKGGKEAVGSLRNLKNVLSCDVSLCVSTWS